MLVDQRSAGRSSAALALSICVHALLLLLLIQAGRIREMHRAPTPERTVELLDLRLEPLPEPAPEQPVAKKEPPRREVPQPAAAQPAPPKRQPETIVREPLPTPPAITSPTPIIPLPSPSAPQPVQPAASTAGNSTAQGSDGTEGAGGGGADGAMLSSAQWIRKPTSDDWAFYFPRAARSFRGTAKVTLSCRVTRSNRVQFCRVVKEDPQGLGLGRAAITMSAKFRVRPLQVNGAARYDLRVRIPLVLASPKSTG